MKAINLKVYTKIVLSLLFIMMTFSSCGDKYTGEASTPQEAVEKFVMNMIRGDIDIAQNYLTKGSKAENYQRYYSRGLFSTPDTFEMKTKLDYKKGNNAVVFVWYKNSEAEKKGLREYRKNNSSYYEVFYQNGFWKVKL